MNRETFAELSPAHQKIMVELCAQMMDDISESFVKDYQVSVDAYLAGGAQMIELTPDEAEKFRAATQPVRGVMERIAQQAGIQDPTALVEEYYRIAATVPVRK